MKRAKIILSLLLALWALTSAAAMPGTTVRRIHIWHGTGVNADVTLTAYLPDTCCGVGVVVCPGGSYHWLSTEQEGSLVARALNRHGVAAFVLHYRVAGIPAFITHWRITGGGNHHPVMLQDLQRSIGLVRANARSWGVDPHRIGAMGFSAGGHLVLCAAAFHATDFLSPLAIHTTVPLSPDFIVPVYPVVTMHEPYVHGRSRRGLLTERYAGDGTLRDSLSMELHAADIQVPVFLLNCQDDPIVDYHNSLLMDSALTACHKPHRYTLLPAGGHGFGVGRDDAVWLTDFMQWLRSINMIDNENKYIHSIK